MEKHHFNYNSSAWHKNVCSPQQKKMHNDLILENLRDVLTKIMEKWTEILDSWYSILEAIHPH